MFVGVSTPEPDPRDEQLATAKEELTKWQATLQTTEFVEFKERLDQDAALKKAFEKLTPGRQRGYLLYFSGAKQTQTRASRVDKYVAKIMAGKGLND